MRDHIEQVKDGIKKIQDGFSQINCGPVGYTLDVLLAAYDTLINKYAPFKVGDRVELLTTPKSANDKSSGWWHCRHFMVPGNTATVRTVSCSSDGLLRFDVEFDRETWIDSKGEEKPVISKHVFCIFESELRLLEKVSP